MSYRRAAASGDLTPLPQAGNIKEAYAAPRQHRDFGCKTLLDVVVPLAPLNQTLIMVNIQHKQGAFTMAKEQQTFYNLRQTTADGNVSDEQFVSEKQYNEKKEKASKVGTQVDVLKAQTFLITTADSIDDVLQVCPDPAVATAHFNYGFTLAQHNVKRDLMKDAEWAGVEGAYDLAADVQTPREKRVADPLSASRRSLKALWAQMHPGAEPPTDDEINAVLASFAGAAPQAATV